MFKTLVSTFAIALAFTASATDGISKYSCPSVAGIDAWEIQIDLENSIATFFKNDIQATVPLTRINEIETLPVQLEYIFSGPDHPFSSCNELTIVFNSTAATATVTYMGLRGWQTEEALDGCFAEPEIE